KSLLAEQDQLTAILRPRSQASAQDRCLQPERHAAAPGRCWRTAVGPRAAQRRPGHPTARRWEREPSRLAIFASTLEGSLENSLASDPWSLGAAPALAPDAQWRPPKRR